MLALVLSHRHKVRLVEQNVRRHQHRVREESGGDVVGVLLGLLLELGHAAQLAELGIAAQNPAQLRVLGNVALNKQDALLRVQSAGEILGQLLQRPAAQVRGILAYGDRVQVHDAVHAVIFVLHGHPVFDRAHIGAQGQVTAGLDAAEHSLFPLLIFHDKTPRICDLTPPVRRRSKRVQFAEVYSKILYHSLFV